jgi:hypothetical protein
MMLYMCIVHDPDSLLNDGTFDSNSEMTRQMLVITHNLRKFISVPLITSREGRECTSAWLLRYHFMSSEILIRRQITVSFSFMREL